MLPPDETVDDELPLTLRPKNLTQRPGPLPRHLMQRTRPRGTMREALSALRRGRLSMAGAILVALLVLVAIFADVLASDLPVVCHVRGSTYFLPNVVRPAALQGGERYDWAIYPLVRFGPSSSSAALTRRIFPNLNDCR